MSEQTTTDWQPGDPLYHEFQHPYSQYLFSIKSQPISEECYCSDAAYWPTTSDDPGYLFEPGEERIHTQDWLDRWVQQALAHDGVVVR